MNSEHTEHSDEDIESRLQRGLAIKPLSDATRQSLRAKLSVQTVPAPREPVRRYWRMGAAVAALLALVAAGISLPILFAPGRQKNEARKPSHPDATDRTQLYDLKDLVSSAQSDERLRRRFFIRADGDTPVSARPIAEALVALCAMLPSGTVSLVPDQLQMQATGSAEYHAQLKEMLARLGEARPNLPDQIHVSVKVIQGTPEQFAELLAGLKPPKKGEPCVVSLDEARAIVERARMINTRVIQAPQVVALSGEPFSIWVGSLQRYVSDYGVFNLQQAANVGSPHSYVSDYGGTELKPVLSKLGPSFHTAGLAWLNRAAKPATVNLVLRVQQCEILESLTHRFQRNGGLPAAEPMRITLEVKDEPLKNALRYISVLTEKTIVMKHQKDESMRVSFRIDNATLKEALDKLARDYGLSIDESEVAKNIIRLDNPPKVSMVFNNTDIREVINTIAIQANCNIVIGAEVTGPITMRLENVPWRDALSAVARGLDFVAIDEPNGTVRITTRAKVARQLEIRIFRLARHKPNSVLRSLAAGNERGKRLVDVLTKMKSDDGKISFEKAADTIVVEDNIFVLAEMQAFIETVDGPYTTQALEKGLTVQQFALRRWEGRIGVELATGSTVVNCILPPNSAVDETLLPVIGRMADEMTPLDVQFTKSEPDAWTATYAKPKAQYPDAKGVLLLITTTPIDFFDGKLNLPGQAAPAGAPDF